METTTPACETRGPTFMEESRTYLESIGYQCEDMEDGFSIILGPSRKALLSINDEKDEFLVTCVVSSLGNLVGNNPGHAVNCLIALLDQNILVRPFSYAVVVHDEEDKDRIASDYPVVLVRGIPIDEVNQKTLLGTMEDLQKALVFADQLLRAASL